MWSVTRKSLKRATRIKSGTLFVHSIICVSRNPDLDLTVMAPCRHEETDTCVFLHAIDLAFIGHSTVINHIGFVM